MSSVVVRFGPPLPFHHVLLFLPCNFSEVVPDSRGLCSISYSVLDLLLKFHLKAQLHRTWKQQRQVMPRQ